MLVKLVSVTDAGVSFVGCGLICFLISFEHTADSCISATVTHTL